jgi:ribosome-associated toxin RatA of RatAB toxin-antitoxin module
VEEQVAERVIIRATPEQCFDILTDFDRYPEWSPDIKAVRVVEADELNRPTRVAFRAAAFGRSTSLTLAYDYTFAPKQLTWVQVDGDLTRRYDGVYDFEVAGEETQVTYRLTVALKAPLPGFVKRRAESRLVGGALKELKARAEGRPLGADSA